MAAYTATSITVTVDERRQQNHVKRHKCSLAFATSAGTYPSNGIPLPSAQTFGFVRNVDYLLVYDTDDASGVVWKYDSRRAGTNGTASGHRLRGYQSAALASGTAAVAAAALTELATTATITGARLSTIWVEAVGW